MKALKTRSAKSTALATASSPKCAENTCAASAAPAMQALNLWKRALAFAMAGNLWYCHCDAYDSVTSDEWTERRLEWDVLVASTRSKKYMLRQGYEQVTGKDYATMLHTFLELVEKSRPIFIKENEQMVSVQFNRHSYYRSLK